jgi:hypothetical protein
MMPYQSYQIYQAERPKSAAETRRADEQLGHMAENVSWLWQHAIRPITLFRGRGRGQGQDRGQDRQPARSALLDATR